MKCASPKCNNEGTVAFECLPDNLYCCGCFDYLTLKLERWNRDLIMTREARRAEAEDHRPARQPIGY